MAVSRQQFMSGDVEANPGHLDEIEIILSTVDDTTFDEEDWNIVIMECISLSAKWELLSGYLGLSISTIDSIKGNFPGDVDSCWSESLKHWIRRNYNVEKFSVPSWRALLNAVARVDKHLFKELAVTHQATVVSPTAPDTVVSDTAPMCSAQESDSKLFSSLDPSTLSMEEKRLLHGQLYRDSMNMVDKFQYLFSATTESLNQRKVPVKALLSNLVGFGPLPPVYTDLNLPKFITNIPQLAKSEKIDDAMLVIANYCSFFNIDMIEYIIRKLGTEKDQMNLSEYKELFNTYAMRRVFQSPHDVHNAMFVLLDETFDSCTVAVLKLFVHNLRQVLKIPPGAILKMCRIAEG